MAGLAYIYENNGNEKTILDANNSNQKQCFVYDGDGNRIKGTVGGVTTTYIGNYMEWTGSTSTMNVKPRYYYAGAIRIEMRTGSSTLNYLLGDHPSLTLGTSLGSQAITADSNGGWSAEIRYYPWGTERYTSGTTPTVPSLCSGQALRA